MIKAINKETEMQSLKEIKEAVRHPYAWPGGYPMSLIMSDGEVMCMDCARKEWAQIYRSTKDDDRGGWKAEGFDVMWEGEMYCCHCGKRIETAYGEDD